VSRIVTGTLALQIQPTDLRKVVEAALDSVRPAIQAKRLHVDIAPADERLMVAADPDRLQQIAWNLLANAVKFTSANGTITIRTQRSESMVQLSIADTGCGIAADFLPRVFERFSQQDSTTTREHGGMGLGLAIVRHLAEMHGGSVSVSSVEHEGSTFTVRLPMAGASAPTDQHVPVNKPLSQLSGIHVLVVDDDTDAREVMTGMLEDRGATVVAVRNATEAYDALRRTVPDVLMCDIGMPVEDGVAFIGRLRRDPDGRFASIPAVAVTAYAQEKDRQRSLRAGFDSHLAKPFSAEEVTAVVQHLAALRTSSAQRSSGV
jgi:CheY-like chemotaxis protein